MTPSKLCHWRPIPGEATSLLSCPQKAHPRWSLISPLLPSLQQLNRRLASPEALVKGLYNRLSSWRHQNSLWSLNLVSFMNLRKLLHNTPSFLGLFDPFFPLFWDIAWVLEGMVQMCGFPPFTTERGPLQQSQSLVFWLSSVATREREIALWEGGSCCRRSLSSLQHQSLIPWYVGDIEYRSITEQNCW